MKASVVHDFKSPLSVEDVAKPEVGQDQLIVKIEASGLCHTDIHAAHGDWPVKPNPPFIPGHEGIGYIETLGEGVTSRTVGQRGAIASLGHACGECRHCPRASETPRAKQADSERA